MASSSGLVITRASYTTQGNRSSSLGKGMIKDTDDGVHMAKPEMENPMDGGAWWAAVHGVVKSQTQLSDFTFTFHFYALEKEMATHSSVLA